MGEAGSISWKRIAGGLAIGHIAAAYSFTASALLFACLVDPDAPLPSAWRTLLKNLALAPLIAAVITILTFFMMLPASLITAPFTCFAACRLRGGLGMALAVGAPIGAAEVAAVLAWDGGFRGPWSHPGLPGDPHSDAMIVASGAAAGLAYAGTVWRLCVRPRLVRKAVS